MSSTLKKAASGHPSSHGASHPGEKTRNRSRFSGRVLMLPLILLVSAGTGWWILRSLGGESRQFVYYTVVRGELPISVMERGTIESQENVQVLCEVDDIPNDNLRGTPIRWIIANGASVEKGDPIVELESQGHIERLDRQMLAREKALAEKIEADAKYDNQKTQNETLEAEAALELELAKLELRMFKDEKSGTHQLAVEDIQRKIDDINTEILAARAKLELAKKDLHATESLFELGYAGKSELDRSKLSVLQSESEFASKMNNLRTNFAALTKKETYEKQMQSMTLEGKRATAERKLVQVKRDNIALLAQAKARKDAADQSFKKEDELLERYRQQVSNCKISAPVSGMIAYAAKDARRWWMEDIRQGVPINPKQVILSIPNLKKMQVKTEVHESVIHRIRTGLPATVRLEAFPDQHFEAGVKSVAVLAEQSADTRVYETVLAIGGEVSRLKPGMTAVVEIHIERLQDVLSVPVQAVQQVGTSTWCYVDQGNGPERREVQLGATNHKFVEVRSGLDEGDQVVLNPMAIVENGGEEATPENTTPTDGPSTEPARKSPASKNQPKSTGKRGKTTA